MWNGSSCKGFPTDGLSSHINYVLNMSSNQAMQTVLALYLQVLRNQSETSSPPKSNGICIEHLSRHTVTNSRGTVRVLKATVSTEEILSIKVQCIIQYPERWCHFTTIWPLQTKTPFTLIVMEHMHQISNPALIDRTKSPWRYTTGRKSTLPYYNPGEMTHLIFFG